MTLLFSLLAFLALLGSGLMAGLFFAFSNSVMASLARLPAPQGAVAMNTINVVIQNPLFLLVFMGTALLCAVLAAKAVLGWGESGAFWLLAGSLLYLVGIFAATIIFNVPLNDALAAVDASGVEGTAMWSRYLAEWLPWNHVRTLAGTAALACFALALR
ncbi:DUF1772 domain-containing protein [Mesorhizobium sp. SP-1A]|uniref:anthrone oxygenase family protein n=1 Tax=Mesorhizobium sp. SP-1A TaxID=3077840 RepID=UPI0028F72955|nr:anthrone oxygenase family protein [Mesorhizobium sp. SP-1A]